MDTHGSIPEPAEAIKTPPTPEPPASTHAGATGRGMAVKVPRRNNGELLRYPPALRGAYGPRGSTCPPSELGGGVRALRRHRLGRLSGHLTASRGPLPWECDT